MRTATTRRIRRAGFTVLETVVASACTLLVLGVAIPAFTAAGDAGDQGATKVQVGSETRHALLRIARELENTSTTASTIGGVARLRITDGASPDAIVQGNQDMGGFEGTLGASVNNENSTAIDAATDVVAGTPGTPGAANAHETTATGSGARGRTQWGRDRTAETAGSTAISANSMRPRHAVIPLNSVLTFQKVASFTIDASGTPVITWSTPVTYTVVNRRLVRTQDGVSSVVCPACVGFRAEISDAGTVILTMVSQRRTHSKGRVVAEAEQLEVSPKN